MKRRSIHLLSLPASSCTQGCSLPGVIGCEGRVTHWTGGHSVTGPPRQSNWQIGQSQHPFLKCRVLINIVAWQTSDTCTTCRCLCFPQFNLLFWFLFIEAVKATNYLLIHTHTFGYCETEMTKLFHLILNHWDDLSGIAFAKVVACHVINLEMSCLNL